MKKQKKQSIKEIRELIQQGAWVYDMPKGMKKVSRPEPLEYGKKLSIDNIKEHISYDGIGFCIFEFIPATKIEDKELSKRWNTAKRAIDRVVQYQGLTALFVEHDMSVVFGISQKIRVMHLGEIIATGTTEDIRADEQVQRIYLGEEL